MAKKLIITIARQYGSGGREIGERIAEILNIPIYDKLLITEAASKGNFNEEVLRKTDESAANSLLYTLAVGSNTLG
nr:cytidylate kinase-like family protein [Oscillospiraceae bacterium]